MTDLESISALRERYYNATVAQRIDVNAELMILRVRTDQPFPRFDAGQYTTLGLGVWEPRVDGVGLSWNAPHGRDSRVPVVRRAYSISCPLLDERGELVGCQDLPFLEFYVALVSRPSDDPPMLTPRLFALEAGSRLQIGPRAHGHYTTAAVRPLDDVAFFATGTGEAPHNAMLSELLIRGHAGRLVSVVCVRYRKDLGYVAQHQALEKRHASYRYLTLTTREPENLDPARPGFVGRQYMQDFVASGRLEQELGYALDPATAQIFLCGSPAMIGAPSRTPEGRIVFPEPPGMVEVLVNRGFSPEQRGDSARLHFEKYW